MFHSIVVFSTVNRFLFTGNNSRRARSLDFAFLTAWNVPEVLIVVTSRRSRAFFVYEE